MDKGENIAKPFKMNWLNTVFLLGIPPLALLSSIWHGITFGITWVEGMIFGIWYLACGLSITVGYHRLFSHRSHDALWPLRLFYALFGAGAFQNSILEWSSDHRRHHKETDSDSDPYDATRGFWWSHFLWILMDESTGPEDYTNVRDLQKDWVVRFQHRFIFPLGFLFGMLAPAVLGYAIAGWGTAIGGFVWGGLVRTVFVHHGTFLINSAAHVWGKQPYATENSSKDSFLLAFFTFGEGYHNFHHTFQADYRNGHRWWQWDPSKWWIRAWSVLKMNDNLKRTPKWSIETAKMQTKFERVASATKQHHDSNLMDNFYARSKQCCVAMRNTLRKIEVKRVEIKRAGAETKQILSQQLADYKQTVKSLRKEFKHLLLEMNTTPSLSLV